MPMDRGMNSLAMTVRVALASILLSLPGCALAAPVPTRSPSVKETRESGSGMLGRALPSVGYGPAPGHLVALLMPAESKWGRSLEWMGESVASHPSAYLGFPGEEKHAY